MLDPPYPRIRIASLSVAWRNWRQRQGACYGFFFPIPTLESNLIVFRRVFFTETGQICLFLAPVSPAPVSQPDTKITNSLPVWGAGNVVSLRPKRSLSVFQTRWQGRGKDRTVLKIEPHAQFSSSMRSWDEGQSQRSDTARSKNNSWPTAHLFTNAIKQRAAFLSVHLDLLCFFIQLFSRSYQFALVWHPCTDLNKWNTSTWNRTVNSCNYSRVRTHTFFASCLSATQVVK